MRRYLVRLPKEDARLKSGEETEGYDHTRSSFLSALSRHVFQVRRHSCTPYTSAVRVHMQRNPYRQV